MALQLEIQKARITGGGFRAGRARDDAVGSISITYDVEASDDGLGNPVNKEDICELHVLDPDTSKPYDQRIPVVNQSLFQWGDEWCPWLICVNKSARRERENGWIWRVVAEYQTPSILTIPEDQYYLRPRPANAAALPGWDQSSFRDDQQVLWFDKQGKLTVLPTGQQYAEPFIEKTTRRVLTVNRFEETFPDINKEITDRLNTIQRDPFLEEGPDPPYWMITAINYLTVIIPFNNGTGYTMHMMQHVVERSNKNKGWNDERALIDTHYLEIANDWDSKQPYPDPVTGATFADALLKVDGTLKDPQNAAPDYEEFQVQPSLSWPFLA